MPETLVSPLASRMPRLAELVGAAWLEARWEGRRAVYLWQVERDLEVLARYVGWPQVATAYRASLRNLEELMAVAYELRAAAKLAPLVDGLELRLRVGTRACDLAVRLNGHWVFVEVTTRDDIFPWRRGDDVVDPPLTARETVHHAFRGTTPDRDIPTRDIPASHELRQAVAHEIGQLPPGELSLVVLGTPNSHLVEVEDALRGDVRLRTAQGRIVEERVPNGLFAVTDDEGGVSGLSGLIWMKLRRHWHDIRTHGRLFLNPKAHHPLPSSVEDVFCRVFDPSAVRTDELRRITRILVEQYRAERITLFGSLAADFPADVVHDASDIDLAVVKATESRFVDRVREALDLVEPRVGLNLLVYTPEEIARAETAGPSFIRDEILAKGKRLFPPDD
jgi:predicted nucleotidyltransferase